MNHIMASFSDASEMNQRVLFGIMMLFAFGLPLIIGGSPFVVLLLLLAVLSSSEYSVITGKPHTMVLVFIVLECVLFYLLRQSNGGLQKVMFVVFVVAIFDTIAYFSGKVFGRHKLCPSISPGKTIEGFIGGIVGVLIFSVPLHFILFVKVHMAFHLIVVLVLAVLSQVGDILESAFKRRHNIKDSSNLIPGHGGVLDRFDGYILVVPTFYVMTIFINFF
ncbi:MAG: phosphatidate cytidylyltransferase [Candidatus Deianiraeaceae bacterium]|jgi:phosphatidate cytidylyltransferase